MALQPNKQRWRRLDSRLSWKYDGKDTDQGKPDHAADGHTEMQPQPPLTKRCRLCVNAEESEPLAVAQNCCFGVRAEGVALAAARSSWSITLFSPRNTEPPA